MIHGKFVEVEPVMNRFYPLGINFYYFCGGRGIGKTYSALDICRKIGQGVADLDIYGEKFLYLRTTKTEAMSVASAEGNAFKKYNRGEGYNIWGDWNDTLGFGNWYLGDEEDKHIGYIAGLSTFSNLRGVDFSDVKFILYDECVPEKKKKVNIDGQGRLLLNMLETINRNRALLGEPEVVLCMLSNAIDLGSPLLSELLITPILNNMIIRNQESYTNYDRALHIDKYKDHVISQEKKEKSKLYKFAKGTGFDEEALSGDFVHNDMTAIDKNVNLQQYYCWIQLENVFVYKHKADDKIYITFTPSTPKMEFKVFEKLKVRELFYWKYKLYVINRCVKYDNYQTKVIFDSMLNYKEPY